MRIFLSRKTAAELGPWIAELFGSRPFRIVTPPEAYTSDFDVALVSRDVTGRSPAEGARRCNRHRGTWKASWR